MKLSAEILARFLAQENAQILFPDLKIDAKEIINLQCYQALCRIQQIIQDDTLEDKECFIRIEEIIYAIEAIGGDVGGRHDF